MRGEAPGDLGQNRSLRCDLRQTIQQDVSEGFGVAHTIEASDFDQLASENSLKALVVVKVDGRIIFFDR